MSSSIASQPHPIVGILRTQGRKASWLAGLAGITRQYASLMLTGQRRTTADFRRVCVRALGLPEEMLFHAEPDSSAETSAA